MNKPYKAIFFDWDGTAVMSRRAPVEEAVEAMKPLLDKGIKLAIKILQGEPLKIILPISSWIISTWGWEEGPIIMLLRRESPLFFLTVYRISR